MNESEITRRTVPGWLVGLLAATGSLIAIGFVSIGFFVSLGGLVIASALALTVGAVVAGVVDPDRAKRNVAVVALYVLVLAAAYLLILPALAGPMPPGTRGGPGVDPPPPTGGAPAVYPQQR